MQKIPSKNEANAVHPHRLSQHHTTRMIKQTENLPKFGGGGGIMPGGGGLIPGGAGGGLIPGGGGPLQPGGGLIPAGGAQPGGGGAPPGTPGGGPPVITERKNQ